jgi:hypothetical protein
MSLSPELERLRDLLIADARAGRVLNYGPIGKLFDLNMDNPQHRIRIGEMLGDVSREEVEQGRPMLSSIVVQTDTDLPGHGFFRLGHELGLVQPAEDEMSFAVRQMKAVFVHWRTAP